MVRQWLLVVVALAFVALGDARAATLVVNSSNDVLDSVCDGAHCSLRDAITVANANGVLPDEIQFSGAMTITPATALPSLSTQTTINGRQGAACTGARHPVQIDGNGGLFPGLVFVDGSDQSRVCGVNIRGFGEEGIQVLTDADSVTIDGCRIGTDATGETADGNGTGILVSGADFATIGLGPAQLQRNTISGNAGGGVSLIASTGSTATGNAIGTDKDGEAAIANGFGVSVAATAPATVVGPDNVISGNTGNGVDVRAGTVSGNVIGLNEAGDAVLGNANGVVAAGGGTVTIGGPVAADANVISGNASRGVLLNTVGTVQGNVIGPAADGEALPAANQDDGVAASDGSSGFTITANTISGNSDRGVEVVPVVTPVTAGTISANRIGLEHDGVGALPNLVGVDVGANAGGVAIEDNLISGNSDDGLGIFGDGTTLTSNQIGLDVTGAAAGNGGDGIVVRNGSAQTTIGGTAAADRNVIGANDDYGILAGQDSATVTIRGNFVGLAPDGSTPRPNQNGLRLDKSQDALVTGNVLSGNTGHGLSILGGVSDDAVVTGNLIGTDATGTLDRGNGQHGVALGNATDAQVGPGNVILGNTFSGIGIGSGWATSTITGNRIEGNDRYGIELNTVDEPTTITSNTISGNAQDGIAPIGPAGEGLSFLANAMVGNGGLGIDLEDDGVTANDAGDGDAGRNRRQNFPVLTSAVSDGTTTTVAGTLDTGPNPIRIDVYASDGCDPSGHGEGETPLGSATIAAGAFSVAVAGLTSVRQVTATATDLTTGDTSELSPCLAATLAQPPAPPPPPPPPPPVGGAGSTTPPVTTLPPLPVPKAPAKIRVRRAGVDAGTLDLLVEITALAKGGKLTLDYESAGRHTKFDVPITGPTLKIRKALPSSQRGKDTGIVTLTYAGSATVAKDDVRLRAADGKALLVRKTATLQSGKLTVDGSISSKAQGVVRIRFAYDLPDGTTKFLDLRAKVAGGAWKLSQAVPAATGQLSIQFTGYEPANMRGEQTAKQVP
jgi:hypothetical protein